MLTLNLVALVATFLSLLTAWSRSASTSPTTQPEPTSPTVSQHSSQDGDWLTPDEVAYVLWTSKHGGVRCPDCTGGPLAGGPRGCSARNCACPACGSEFSLTILWDMVLGERITAAGPRDLGERGCLYGLPAQRPAAQQPAL